jgi:hypothetical protein
MFIQKLIIGSELNLHIFSFYIERSIGVWEETRQNRPICPKLGGVRNIGVLRN